jgi:hypothetical protein
MNTSEQTTFVGYGPNGAAAYKVTDENGEMVKSPRTGSYLWSSKEISELAVQS